MEEILKFPRNLMSHLVASKGKRVTKHNLLRTYKIQYYFENQPSF